MEDKLKNIMGKIAGASFIAKMNGDETLSKMLVDIAGDISKIIKD